MDLLKTMVLYLAMVFATSVETAPEASLVPETPVATPYVQATATPVPTASPTPVPTIAITPNPAYKTLQVGDRGNLVREMQEKLIEYGYLEGEADGAYGNQTRRAVEAFQYQHGLSVDGIAGRRTLTVLYESDEVRMAPQAQDTPAPTATSQLVPAITPDPDPTSTPAPTAEPSSTPEATSTPAPTQTPEPAREVQPMEVMEGYVYALSSGETLELPVYGVGEDLYLPLVELLRAGNRNVIATSSVEAEEFAFAIGEELIRLSYTENQQGEPEGLEAYRGTMPQILPVREIRRMGESVYLPAVTVESLTGITAETDEADRRVVVTLP